MLKELASKDQQWKRIALVICKCPDAANELVQEMYLKVYDVKLCTDKQTKSYISRIMLNLYRDKLKKTNNTIRLGEGFDIPDEHVQKGYNDKELSYLVKTYDLTEDEKNMLVSTYDNVLRDIAEDNDTSTNKVFRKLKEVRTRILGDDFDKEYKNRRLKYKKQ